MKSLAGYTDRISVAPGERIAFKVSAENGATSYKASLVRLFSTDDHPDGPGLGERPVRAPFDGRHPARRQAIPMGSCVTVLRSPKLEKLRSVTLAAVIWPTTPRRGRQAILGGWSGGRGIALEIDEIGAASLRIDGNVFSTGKPLLVREWYRVAASYDHKTGIVEVIQEHLVAYPRIDDAGGLRVAGPIGRSPAPRGTFSIGANAGTPFAQHFNGKIGRPRVAKRVLTPAEAMATLAYRVPKELRSAMLAAWDFALDTPSQRIVDTTANKLDGATINLPARGMKGHAWTGRVHDWRAAPDEYDAIHFHDDDVYDAGWSTDFEYMVPLDLPSGVYAAKLEGGADPEHVVFFVRPPRGRATADVCYLAATATYMAYANFRVMNRSWEYEAFQGALLQIGPEDLFLNDHPDYGDSLYGSHSDGSGVCYSSRLRPIVNMRPHTPLWAFSGDNTLLAWMDALGYRADTLTDEDLDAEGVDLIAAYKVVVTGCHPEYWSLPMWDAMQAYLDRSGCLMYLGGNGFYWRVAYHPTLPGVIEVRRAEDGTRAWAAEPGEYYMSFTGEYGGLWRRQDRTPNQLVGVGMTAQGFDCGSYYRRAKASFDPRVAFIFEGIGADELIGNFGTAGGGAAGQELDRYDRALGSPPHALVVATSEEHTDNMLLVNEDFRGTYLALGGTENKLVRADMTFFETPAGGAVFSTGSISWIASLPNAAFDNNVARITRNVLDRFLDPTPFR
ncbi:MAG: N,N-dimethylformamidase [Alphaproteobacteria bacterium]|nr:N,N-dimethylformamidase [Alphaproteobacteria bacterium]